MPVWGVRVAGDISTTGEVCPAFTFQACPSGVYIDTGSPSSFARTLQLLALSRGARHLSTDPRAGCKRKTHLELLRDQGVSEQPREAAPQGDCPACPLEGKRLLHTSRGDALESTHESDLQAQEYNVQRASWLCLTRSTESLRSLERPAMSMRSLDEGRGLRTFKGL